MSMPRIQWFDLPVEAREAVTEHTGLVVKVEQVSSGTNSAVAALVHSVHETVFVKGIPAKDPQAVTQQREVDVSRYVPPACPRLLWRVQEAGWDLIGYEYIEGRHADYTPGSPDLVLVCNALAEVQRVVLPAELGVKDAAERWAPYAAGEDTSPLAGGHLLHTDLAPHNVLISDYRAHVIDWAWPTRGAAWIDPALFILRLIEAGHTAAAADVRADQQFISWGVAPPDAVRMFSDANVRVWDEILLFEPRPRNRRTLACARTWRDYWRRKTGCGRM